MKTKLIAACLVTLLTVTSCGVGNGINNTKEHTLIELKQNSHHKLNKYNDKILPMTLSELDNKYTLYLVDELKNISVQLEQIEYKEIPATYKETTHAPLVKTLLRGYESDLKASLKADKNSGFKLHQKPHETKDLNPYKVYNARGMRYIVTKTNGDSTHIKAVAYTYHFQNHTQAKTEVHMILTNLDKDLIDSEIDIILNTKINQIINSIQWQEEK